MPAEHGDVLLDTHVLLWWRAGSPRLSATALGVIAAAKSPLVSPVTCWEVSMLVGKGRVRLDRPTAAWVRDVLAHERVAVAALSSASAVAATELPGLPRRPRRPSAVRHREVAANGDAVQGRPAAGVRGLPR